MSDIEKKIGNQILVFDGAMGTALQSKGLGLGEIPESWNLNSPDKIKDVHREYIAAGADIITSNSFGANALKLGDKGFSVKEIIGEAIKLAKQSVEESGKNVKVALGLGPSGQLMAPTGDMTFEEAYQLFAEQVLAGPDADLILLETFSDIGELRAAVLACKENSDLPVIASCTFEGEGKMLLGTKPLTAVSILQDMGLAALGLNCSLGPKEIIPIFKELAKYSRIPLLVQPNAGIPRDVDGCAVYDVEIDEYIEAMKSMIDLGAGIVGGCCGTNPSYISALKELVLEMGDHVRRRDVKQYPASSSATETVFMSSGPVIIGERINPTGKKLLKEALRKRDFIYIEDEALAQVKDGAELLEVNLGLPDIDEVESMGEAVERISRRTRTPLMIDSKDTKAIERAIRSYPGSPIINSVSGEQASMDEIFPLVEKYGTSVVALTLDERGLPKNLKERFEILDKIVKEAKKYSISSDRLLVDFLTLTISAEPMAAVETLKAIRKATDMGFSTVLGASNVSFGLPNRPLLNETFLAMAFGSGLTAAITDPRAYKSTLITSKLLLGKDKEALEYIWYNKSNLGEGKRVEKLEKKDKTLEEIILHGFEDRAAQITADLLKEEKALDIIEKRIVPTLEEIGRQYDSGEIFLPQMISSADTVKKSFEVLRETMQREGTVLNYGKLILATVQGDIHDIGKNIVKAILENYGFEVIDLGKDVPIERVVETARIEKIKFVGLSALMTTTVVNMKKTIEALREDGQDCAVVVGGAVLTDSYAQEIGADYYCETAIDAVKVARKVFKEVE